MKTYYVVRHGETDFNIEKRYQGQVETQLNETGKQQIMKLQDIIRELVIDIIITSPAQRARQTTRILNVNNVPVIESVAFLERALGVYEGLTKEEAASQYPDLWNKEITRIIDDAPTGGETVTQVENRVFLGLDELKKMTQKNILIVTHNFTSKVINKYFNPHLSGEEYLNFILKNGEMAVYKA